jgi:response regulator RpfG family c-di-GMP phosphodiesterase
VDDVPAVLGGYKRILYPEFEVDIAESAAKAFAAIEAKGPYAVVVSDMRMPVMNGAEFLGKVRQTTPDTVRMLLSGFTDLKDAIQAVNQGNIFRFLTKPCEPDVLAGAINAGIEQFRLITSERELLEETLMGSIKVLTDVLSAASPEAFGRSLRINHYVRHIMAKVKQPPSRWCIEAAATLSQLGCITLESELVQRVYGGAKLTEEEQAKFDAHPQAAMELLRKIPGLEAVSWIICQQLKPDISESEASFPGFSAAELLRSAKIVKLALAFELLRERFPAKGAALARLRDRSKQFEPGMIDALIDLQPFSSAKELRKGIHSQAAGRHGPGSGDQEQ